MASINFSGLITGLDTDRIIQGLLDIQNRRIQTINSRKDQVTIRNKALAEVENRLRALQDSLFTLARSQNNVFDSRKVQVNFPELAKITSSSNATPGTYSFQALSTARAHQLASQGFDTPDSAITTGNLQIQVGNSSLVTVNIDSTNNTLQGLANAINAANAGVTATIIHDGSPNSTQPYRLILTANNSGAANSIRIINNLGSDSGSARKPVFEATYVGPAVSGPTNTSTAVATSNQGPGNYNGTASKVYTVTVLSGGVVGSDTITLQFQDSTGTYSGTVTLTPGDVDGYKTLAEGVQIKFSAGSLITGDTFTIDVFAPVIQAPANAAIRIGSGAGALTIESSSNTFDSVFPGLSISLQGADPSRTVQVTISPDVEQMRQAITSFVEKYNELMSYLNEQTAYNTQTGQAAPLFGNRTAVQIQDDLRRLASDVIPGLPTQANRLSAMGITLTDQGTLQIDNTRLEQVLNSQITGITLEDVRRLFAFTGRSSNPGIRFVVGGLHTDSSGVPIQVDITQAAEQASVLATNPLASSTVIDASNNRLNLIVDGKLYDITLNAGTYSRQSLAEELQNRINAAVRQDGREVSVTVEGDRLRIRSQSYGSRSEIGLASGSALAPLGFNAGQRDLGQDVAGVFIIHGQIETARGTGQLLTGEDSNRYTSGLQVRVTLNGSQLVPGAEGELILTRGVAARLDRYIFQSLDPITGIVSSGKKVLGEEAQRLQESIDRLKELIQQKRDSLEKQFRHLESVVGQLRGLGDMLTLQFQALLNNNLRVTRR